MLVVCLVTNFVNLKLYLKEDSDVFAIVEAGASTDHLEYYRHHGYVFYTLPRSRQIASSIIVKIKNNITANFKILHEMQDNTFGAVELNLWKGNTQTKLIFAYNPPGNPPLIHILESSLDKNIIIIGDFNSHSPKWGYRDINPQGRIMEDFLDSLPVTLVQGIGHTFFSFKGKKTHPDLTISHANNTPTTSLELLESCRGYGRGILYVKRCQRGHFQQPNMNSPPRWNLKKADWVKFSDLTDLLLTLDIMDEANADKSWDTIFETIRICALETIPRGKIKNYKPFWTMELADLKLRRDRACIQAELMGDSVDNIALQ
ncbi:uncharacterized protein TNIN_475361 [Trichonephila inaurata madagascariensis]|uniref:Endonuclease/exonuclease/phosphatase domain-containing protein n=1 Tax=Trichonephila inaurata madagascariensis TaxID=2747483 RepID=A0A8X6X7G7_9ARAC|nr:uncharacterized protein TNIN_475361 [Trichonephila inaurata madagascariensis]